MCHVNPETTTSHLLVAGFVYEDNACLVCHPTGDADVVFDHSTTGFPLTGVHKIVNCVDCHTNGFQNTPTTCVSCHQAEYAATSNPDHQG